MKNRTEYYSHFPLTGALLLMLMLMLLLPSCMYEEGRTVELNTRKLTTDLLDESAAAYEYETIPLRTDRTALVIIDMWEDEPVIDGLAEYRVSPLLRLAREQGLTVVHAPSQNPDIHSSCMPDPGEIVVYGYQHIDRELALRGIDTILFSGFDTFKCVLDKPMGIFQTLERNTSMRVIIIRDAVLSRKESWKRVATDMVERDIGRSTSLPDLYAAFGTAPPAKIYTDITVTGELTGYDSLGPGEYFSAENSALVLSGTGALEISPAGTFGTRASETIHEIQQVLAEARSRHITVIHVPGGFGNAASLSPLEGEPVIDNFESLIDIVEGNSIKVLFYAGFAANRELLTGPAGLIRLYIRGRYGGKYIPRYIVLSDCTAAIETADTIAEEISLEVSLSYRDTVTVTSDRFPDLFQ